MVVISKVDIHIHGCREFEEEKEYIGKKAGNLKKNTEKLFMKRVRGKESLEENCWKTPRILLPLCL